MYGDGVCDIVISSDKTTPTDVGADYDKHPHIIEGIEIDSRRAWFLLAASTASGWLMSGTMLSTGVLMTVLVKTKEFPISPATVAWIASLQYGMCYTAAPLSPILLSRLGTRYCMLLGYFLFVTPMIAATFSGEYIFVIFVCPTVAGFGSAIFFVPASCVGARYFRKYQAYAVGIGISGLAAGQLTIPLLIQILHEQIAWRNAYRVLGAAGILVALVSMPAFPNKIYTSASTRRRSIRCTGCKSTVDLSIFKTLAFDMWLLAGVLANVGYQGSMIHLSRYATESGISPRNSAMLYTYAGSVSLVSRLLVSRVTDLIGLTSLSMHILSMLVISVFCMAVPFMTDQLGFIFAACLFGLGEGMFQVMAMLSVCLLLGEDRLFQGWGFALAIQSLGIHTGPLLLAHIREVTLSYKFAYFTAGGFLSAGAICLCFIRLILYLRQRRERKQAQLLPSDLREAVTSKPDFLEVVYSHATLTPSRHLQRLAGSITSGLVDAARSRHGGSTHSQHTECQKQQPILSAQSETTNMRRTNVLGSGTLSHHFEMNVPLLDVPGAVVKRSCEGFHIPVLIDSSSSLSARALLKSPQIVGKTC